MSVEQQIADRGNPGSAEPLRVFHLGVEGLIIIKEESA